MNKNIEKAYELNKFSDWDCGTLPDLEIGDICTISDIWDGDGPEPCDSYCYRVSDTGEDGENIDTWIDYVFEVIEESDEDFLDTKIKITDIRLI